VLVSVLFVGLAGINLLAQLRYSVTGRQAVGTVVEFHFSAGRSRSVTAQVDVALGDRPVFRWEVQDPLGLQAWAPAARVPLLCAHIHADHVSCVLDSYADRYLFSGVMLLFGLGIAGFGATRLLRRKVATGAGASAAGA